MKNIIETFKINYCKYVDNYLPENFELCCYFLTNNLYFSDFDLPNYKIIKIISKYIDKYGYYFLIRNKFNILRLIILMSINSVSFEQCLKFVDNNFETKNVFLKTRITANDITKINFSDDSSLAKLINYFNNINFGNVARDTFYKEEMYFIYNHKKNNNHSIYNSLANRTLVNRKQTIPDKLYWKFCKDENITNEALKERCLIDFNQVDSRKMKHFVLQKRAKDIANSINEFLQPL